MTQNKDLKIDIKNFLRIVGLLYAVLIIVGILTYIIPAGMYAVSDSGEIIPESFEYIESATRLPWYRWLTAPFEGVVFGDGNVQILQITAIIVLLGGCFKVLESSGAINSLIKVLINRFKKKRFLAIWIITILMMLLSSLFGLQEELLILFPIFMSFAGGMGWSRETALALVLITSGTGFTAALLNPFTVGICCNLAGIAILDGAWYRLIIFAVLFVLTSLFLVRLAKADEQNKPNEQEADKDSVFLDSEDERRAALIIGLFGFVLLLVVTASVIPALQSLAMIIMGAAFLVGTAVIGGIMIGSGKAWLRAFGKGVGAVAPSIFIIMAAFSIKYIADRGNILHTLFHGINNLVDGTSPYLAVVILYLFVLVIEFFIPSATAKALLIIPLLTLAPLPGISKAVIVLIYIFGDGYTNILFPTSGTLMIGLGIADVSYFTWFKKTALFQIALFFISCAFLMLAVALKI